jgi:predicted DNA-binding transcriptional regulator AlpA
MEAFLTSKQLRECGVPLSDASIDRLVAAGDFPRPVRLGRAPNSPNYWIKAEVERWLEGRISARESTKWTAEAAAKEEAAIA